MGFTHTCDILQHAQCMLIHPGMHAACTVLIPPPPSSAPQCPNPSAMGPLLQPVSAPRAALGARAEGRRTPGFNHIKALAESVQCLSWLAYTGPSCGEITQGEEAVAAGDHVIRGRECGSHDYGPVNSPVPSPLPPSGLAPP